MVATSAVAIAASYQSNFTYQSNADGSSSLDEQISASIAEENSNGDVFGEAVTIDVSLTQSASQSGASSSASAAETTQDQDLQQAVNTLKSGQQEIESQQKKEAAQKLVLAAEELEFLKLLGTGIEAAQQAVKIAKDVQSAVQQYAGAGSTATTAASTAAASDAADSTASTAAAAGTTGSTTTAASTAAAASATAAASTATTGIDDTATGDTATGSTAAAASTAAGTTASSTTASSTTGSSTTGSSATGSVPDPFYSLANAILGALGKFLHKVLPPLQADSDKKTSKEAEKLGQSFADTLSTVQTAEAGNTQTSLSNALADDADIASAVSAAPLNLLV
jgi:hypothetical protein